MYAAFAVAKRKPEFAGVKRNPEKNQPFIGAHDLCDMDAVVVF